MQNASTLRWVFVACFVQTLLSCGSSSSTTSTDTSSTTTTVSWSDVKSTVSSKCGGSACHSSGASQINLVDNETNMKAKAKTAATYLRSTSNPMPPSRASALTSTEKSQLLSYLDGQ